jgi:hypothetical protein
VESPSRQRTFFFSLRFCIETRVRFELPLFREVSGTGTWTLQGIFASPVHEELWARFKSFHRTFWDAAFRGPPSPFYCTVQVLLFCAFPAATRSAPSQPTDATAINQSANTQPGQFSSLDNGETGKSCGSWRAQVHRRPLTPLAVALQLNP